MIGKQQRPRQSVEHLDHNLRKQIVMQRDDTARRLGKPRRGSVHCASVRRAARRLGKPRRGSENCAVIWRAAGGGGRAGGGGGISGIALVPANRHEPRRAVGRVAISLEISDSDLDLNGCLVGEGPLAQSVEARNPRPAFLEDARCDHIVSDQKHSVPEESSIASGTPE